VAESSGAIAAFDAEAFEIGVQSVSSAGKLWILCRSAMRIRSTGSAGD